MVSPGTALRPRRTYDYLSPIICSSYKGFNQLNPNYFCNNLTKCLPLYFYSSLRRKNNLTTIVIVMCYRFILSRILYIEPLLKTYWNVQNPSSNKTRLHKNHVLILISLFIYFWRTKLLTSYSTQNLVFKENS